MVAFGLSPLQRHDAEPMGGPVWVDSNLYDVEMKATDLPTVPQARALMLALLEDRFKLRWHTEQRELPVYALVFARSDRQLAAGIKPSMLSSKAPP